VERLNELVLLASVITFLLMIIKISYNGIWKLFVFIIQFLNFKDKQPERENIGSDMGDYMANYKRYNIFRKIYTNIKSFGRFLVDKFIIWKDKQ